MPSTASGLAAFKRALFLMKITTLIYIVVIGNSTINGFRNPTFRNVTVNNSTVQMPSMCIFSSTLQSAYNLICVTHLTITFFIVVTANLVIIRKVFKSKKALNKKSVHSLSKKDYSFAFSLMANNIIYFILVAPFMCVQIVQMYSSLAPNQPNGFVNFTNLLFTT